MINKIEECGSFYLHADDTSMMVYDIQFWLYSYLGDFVDKEIITFGKFTRGNTNINFTSGGYTH